MKILYRYILRSHLLSLGMTLIVFTFVLLLGNTFKDAVALLSNRNIGLTVIFQVFLFITPYILSFSMPMALLAATLLVIGRISADQELNACRASGISFLGLTLPVLGVAAALSLICLYVNCFLAPENRFKANQAFVEIAFKNPSTLLEEGQSMNLDGMTIYIGRVHARKNTLENVRVVLTDGSKKQDIRAERGTVSSNFEQKKVLISLFNTRVDEWDPTDPDNFGKRSWGRFFEAFPPIELDMTKLVDQRRAVKEVHHLSSRELWKQALELKTKGIHPTPMLVEMHKRVALSFACISFVLIALPLGIHVQRREASIGILMSLGLAIFYYLLILLAEGMKKSTSLSPEWIELMVWIPNLVFQTLGLYLLWRQRRV